MTGIMQCLPFGDLFFPLGIMLQRFHTGCWVYQQSVPFYGSVVFHGTDESWLT